MRKKATAKERELERAWRTFFLFTRTKHSFFSEKSQFPGSKRGTLTWEASCCRSIRDLGGIQW